MRGQCAIEQTTWSLGRPAGRDRAVCRELSSDAGADLDSIAS
jgi:hypothetical protein